MKHIRRYNESDDNRYSDFVEYIVDIAEQTLSFTKDKGYTYTTNSDIWEKSNDSLLFSIKLDNNLNVRTHAGINWFNLEDIKVDLMQFVELVSLRYETRFIALKLNRMYFNTPKVYIEVDDFLNNKIDLDEYQIVDCDVKDDKVGYVTIRFKNK